MGRDCGCVFSAIISIILGVIIGILVFTGIIVELVVLISTIIGLIGFALLLFVLIALFGPHREDICICEYGKCFIIGVFGTIFLALAIIGVFDIASLTALAVLFGIGGFFFILSFINFLKLLLCLVRSSCGCRE